MLTAIKIRSVFLMLASVIFAIIVSLLIIGCAGLSGPRYQGPVSDHFDGERFINQQPLQHAGFGDFLYWMFTRDPGKWHEWTDAQPGPPPPEKVSDGRLRVTFINHSTVLIQSDGLNILTDPIWSDRASPYSWIGPHRVRPPGIHFKDLPPIDVVLISHNHYDHLDLPTLVRLADKHKPLFVVGLGNAALLQSVGITNVQELDWWQHLSLNNSVRLTGVPTQHFSARGLCDRDATLWTGYVIQGAAGNVYFAGDTGYGPQFEQIRERLGSPRLALLPIGAFRPRWFMARVHLSPQEALRAHHELDAKTSVAIHHSTFKLADDGQEEPIETLKQAVLDSEKPALQFWVLDFGEGREVPPIQDAD